MSGTDAYGGVFLIVNDAGLFWDGARWLPQWEGARHFDVPPDAYADCALAVSCLRKLGTACHVAYVPFRPSGCRRTSRRAPLRR